MQRETSLITATLGWGTALWLIGYLVGIGLFMVVKPELIGWFITPIGFVLTGGVLWKKIHRLRLRDFVLIGIIWTALAMILDYVFLVTLFNSTTYYKLDVYVYYASTLLLPIGVGMVKVNRKRPE